MLIGVCGKLGSGKDYILSHVIIPIICSWNETYLHLNLADQIKINVMTKDKIPYHDVYIQKTQTTRRLLQLEGTEKGRDVHGQDIWINYFHNWKSVFESRGITFILCSDVRFINEFNYFKEQGGFLIKIHAPELNHERLVQESNGDEQLLNQIKNHPSECQLDNLQDSEFDLIVHNFKGIKLEQIQQEFLHAFNSLRLS